MKIFDRLFNKDSRSRLSQKSRQNEREAVADLLLYGVYGTDELKLREEVVLKADSPAFGWESGIEFNYYRHAAINRIHEMVTKDDGQVVFLTSIAERLQSSEMASQALELLNGFLSKDKNVPASGETAVPLKV